MPGEARVGHWCLLKRFLPGHHPSDPQPRQASSAPNPCCCHFSLSPHCISSLEEVCASPLVHLSPGNGRGPIYSLAWDQGPLRPGHPSTSASGRKTMGRP